MSCFFFHLLKVEILFDLQRFGCSLFPNSSRILRCIFKIVYALMWWRRESVSVCMRAYAALIISTALKELECIWAAFFLVTLVATVIIEMSKPQSVTLHRPRVRNRIMPFVSSEALLAQGVGQWSCFPRHLVSNQRKSNWIKEGLPISLRAPLTCPVTTNDPLDL